MNNKTRIQTIYYENNQYQSTIDYLVKMGFSYSNSEIQELKDKIFDNLNLLEKLKNE